MEFDIYEDFLDLQDESYSESYSEFEELDVSDLEENEN